MGFATAVRTCFAKYIRFRGRAIRAEFWWFCVFNILGGIATSLLDTAVGANANSGPFSGAFGFATFLPAVAVGVRRLHDTGRSGCWLLAPIAFVLTFAVILLLATPWPPQGDIDLTGTTLGSVFIVAVLGVFGSAVVLLIWLTSRSDDGDNRFGPNPSPPLNQPA